MCISADRCRQQGERLREEGTRGARGKRLESKNKRGKRVLKLEPNKTLIMYCTHQPDHIKWAAYSKAISDRRNLVVVTRARLAVKFLSCLGRLLPTASAQTSGWIPNMIGMICGMSDSSSYIDMIWNDMINISQWNDMWNILSHHDSSKFLSPTAILCQTSYFHKTF